MNVLLLIVLAFALQQTSLAVQGKQTDRAIVLTVNIDKKEFSPVRDGRSTLILHTKLRYENRGSGPIILSKDSNLLPIRFLISASKSAAEAGDFEHVTIPFTTVNLAFNFENAPDSLPDVLFSILEPGQSLELPFDAYIPVAISNNGGRDVLMDGKEHFLQFEFSTFPYSQTSPRPVCTEDCRKRYEEKSKSIGVLWSQPVRSEVVKIQFNYP